MNHSNQPIEFYFDYISHNAYIAWFELKKMAEKYDVPIKPIPTLFAGLLYAHHQRGPAEVAAKLDWMTGNLLRKAALLDMPLNPPASHPFNPLPSLRASLITLDQEKQFLLIDKIFQATWADSRDVGSVDVIAEIFTECGIDKEQALAESQSQAIKDQLRHNTDAAIARDVFGVPSMMYNNELFWGYDDFPYLELVVKGEDPLAENYLEPWLKVKSTVQRDKNIPNARQRSA